MNTEASVEIVAPSVEEAVILGLTRLALTRDEVEIEVLDEGSRGFLGLGMRQARVRLSARGALPLEAGPEPLTASEPEPPAAAPATTAIPAPASEPTHVRVHEPEPALPSPIATVAAAELTPQGLAMPVSDGGTAPVLPQEPATDARLDRSAVAQAAVDVAAQLLRGLRVEVDTSWEEEEQPALWIAAKGRDASLLVGPQGQTLDAVQYLFRTLLHRRLSGNFNVVVDADSYRLRRRRNLEAIASEKANAAVEAGRTIRLRPMPADERRVIHMALRDDERVRTESVGRGSDRAVTIIPKKLSD